MNDDFLSDFRQTPRSEFTQTLYIKLKQSEKAGLLMSQSFMAKRIAFVLAALCLTFALTIALSPNVRAAALAAVDSINSDYAGHCRASSEIAREYFSYDVVLPKMLQEVGLS